MIEPATDTLVDGRYRILNRIGSGGMAEVYLAEDTQLGRQVALKMLHRRFVEDPQFVERFRREASSAAGLQHPNVVGVFDRGDHDGTYYIAMEYLEGRTLKRLIAEEAPLAQERAIDIALQILAAAGFAHGRGVVHRDFKPQNVVVDEKDNVKVTDFGIASAGASELTETGSILGTAHYLSPEQAQGHGVSAASDLYSIGVMLYEMLAGRLPFEADSAVAVAVQHISHRPPPLSEARPDVHPGLEATVMRALAKASSQRWGTAAEFVAALQAARAAIAMGDEGQGTAVWAALPAPEGPSELPERRRRRWPLALGFALLAGAAAALILLTTPAQVRVPEVVGRTLAQAQPALERAGLRVVVEKEEDEAPLNEVIEQDPAAGAEVDEGSTVTLSVSTGPGTADVPGVEGLTEQEAIRRLNRAGFQAETDEEFSANVPEGAAVRTLPGEGTERRVGTRILLFISAGPKLERVPRVLGLSRALAESELDSAGFDVSVQESDSDAPEDEVIAQSPDPGTDAEKGSTVTLTVSNGDQQASEVPGVSGLPESRARATLREAGFRVVTRDARTRSPGAEGIVVRQDPGQGAELRRGETVEIFVGRFNGSPSEDPVDEPPAQR